MDDIISIPLFFRNNSKLTEARNCFQLYVKSLGEVEIEAFRAIKQQRTLTSGVIYDTIILPV